MMKRSPWLAGLALAAALAAGCAGHGAMTTQHVAVAVTDQGFVPPEVTVHKGQPVALEVIRKTGKPFAKELDLPSSGVHKDLPYNEPVVINFTPRESGMVEYSVGGDLYQGRIVVQ